MQIYFIVEKHVYARSQIYETFVRISKSVAEFGLQGSITRSVIICFLIYYGQLKANVLLHMFQSKKQE